MLQAIRRSTVKARTQTANQIHNVAVAAPEPIKTGSRDCEAARSSKPVRRCAPPPQPIRRPPRLRPPCACWPDAGGRWTARSPS